MTEIKGIHQQQEENLIQFVSKLSSRYASDINGTASISFSQPLAPVLSSVCEERCGKYATGSAATVAIKSQIQVEKCTHASPLISHLYRDKSDPIMGGAMCRLPSFVLDPPTVDEDGDYNASNKNKTEAVNSTLNEGKKVSRFAIKPMGNVSRQSSATLSIPAMTASVLDMNKDFSSDNASAAILEPPTTNNLISPVIWTRSSLPAAPEATLRSFVSSFGSILSSRMRECTLQLLGRSLAAREGVNQTGIKALLSSISSWRINLEAAVMNFRALKMPVEINATSLDGGEKKGVNVHEIPKVKIDNERKWIEFSKNNCNLVLPLIVEILVDVSLKGKRKTAKIKVPGTVAANFLSNSPLITHIEIELDAETLFSSMVKQAQDTTLVLMMQAMPLSHIKKNNVSETLDKQTVLPTSLKSLNMTPSLSALRNSLSYLQTKRPSTVGISQTFVTESSLSGNNLNYHSSGTNLQYGLNRGLNQLKNQSVTWKESNEVATFSTNQQSNQHNTKRQKTSYEGSKLKRSCKSFGRPDSGTFPKCRNATFAEFGQMKRLNLDTSNLIFRPKVGKNQKFI